MAQCFPHCNMLWPQCLSRERSSSGGRRRLIHMFRFKQRMTTQSLGQSTFEECVIRRSFSGSPGTFQRRLLAVLTISRSSVWQHIWSNRCGWVGSWHSKVGKESNRKILANMFQFSQYVENYSVFSIGEELSCARHLLVQGANGR